MKKQICAVLLVLAAAAAFGADFSLSAGAGGFLGGFFTRYSLNADGTVEGAQLKIDATQKMNQFDYGFFAFFDATYGVFSVFFQRGIGNYEETAEISVFSDGTVDTGKGWETVLGFSLLGKYPFSVGEKVLIFPMLGIEYHKSLIQKRTQSDGFVYKRDDGLREKDKDNNAYKLSDWDSFWVNVGGGIDYALTDSVFFRGELLYSFRLMTSYEKKNLEMMKALAGDPDPKLGGLTSGPKLKLSVGRRF